MKLTRPPQSGSPSSAWWYTRSYSSPLESLAPAAWSSWEKSFTQASRSEVQVLQWTMATGSPAGVATRSISRCTWDRGFSSTTMAKMEVPADTFPVLGETLLVAAMPVPASPSGGQKGTPGRKAPVGSRSLAPSSVSSPAGSPASRTWGSTCSSFQGRRSRSSRPSNWESIFEQNRPGSSTGNMPAASPTPSTFCPVSFQWTYPARVVR